MPVVCMCTSWLANTCCIPQHPIDLLDRVKGQGHGFVHRCTLTPWATDLAPSEGLLHTHSPHLPFHEALNRFANFCAALHCRRQIADKLPTMSRRKWKNIYVFWSNLAPRVLRREDRARP